MLCSRNSEVGSSGSFTPTTARCCSVLHALPTELLREIFTLVVAGCKKVTNLTSNVYPGPVNTDIRPPLALSQTCHQWRDIALDMPVLWTAVSNMATGAQKMPTQVNRRLVALFVSRTKHLPLSVLLMADARATTKLAPRMNRVRSLELVDFPDPSRLDLLVHPAPVLEYLLLSSPPSRSSMFTTRQAPVLFAGHAPSLCALALINAPFLPRQPFSALSDLYIGGLSKPRLQDVLELLRGTPALESLALADLCIPLGLWLFAGQHQQAPAVPLPRLRRFALVRTALTRAIMLLEHLVVPRNAAVHLLELFADRHIDPLVAPLPQLPSIAAATALEMVVCGSTLSFCTHVRALDGFSEPVVPRVRCTAHWSTYAYGWWRGLWQMLPCSQLTALRVAVDAEDDELLPRFLDAAIVLATLELRLHPRDRERRRPGENAVLADCLDGAPQALLGVCALLEQELPVVCPCLAELAVIDASSTLNAWDGFLSGEETSPRVAYVPDILCVVAARAAAGRRLRRVALQGLWARGQRERVRSAFGMGAAVTEFEFGELDAETHPLFEFADDGGEDTWVNDHWVYELPKRMLP